MWDVSDAYDFPISRIDVHGIQSQRARAWVELQRDLQTDAITKVGLRVHLVDTPAELGSEKRRSGHDTCELVLDSQSAGALYQLLHEFKDAWQLVPVPVASETQSETAT